MLAAAVLAIVALLAAGLLPVDELVRDALIDIANRLCPIIVGADAAIRVGRAFNSDGVLRAKVLHAQAQLERETVKVPVSAEDAE